MNKRLLGLLAAASLLTGGISQAAHAADSSDVAAQLGSVIGSEQACGLTYDQDAIQRFVDQHVDAGDMEFPSMLSTFTDGTKAEIQDMTQSALTAHCAQIRRIAKHYGFINSDQ